MTDDTPPSPGSDAAIQQGCTCPVMDNAHGRGYMGVSGVYVYSGDCPLHRIEPEPRYIDDGFGTEWKLCDKPNCQLAVVRPGKAECQRCDKWTEQDELDRSKHRAEIY